jgi:hypothetical protein
MAAFRSLVIHMHGCCCSVKIVSCCGCRESIKQLILRGSARFTSIEDCTLVHAYGTGSRRPKKRQSLLMPFYLPCLCKKCFRKPELLLNQDHFAPRCLALLPQSPHSERHSLDARLRLLDPRNTPPTAADAPLRPLGGVAAAALRKHPST